MIDTQAVKEAQKAGETNQLVVFKIANEEYGIDIQRVSEIVMKAEITHMPQAPGFIEGIISLRGTVLCTISLAKRFDLPVKKWDPLSRIIVVKTEGAEVGLMVDSVSEIIKISPEVLKPAPSLITAGIEGDFLTGIADIEDRIIIVLDLEKLLSKEEIKHLAEIYKEKKAEAPEVEEAPEVKKEELDKEIKEKIKEEAKELKKREAKEEKVEAAEEKPIVIEEEEPRKPKKKKE